MKTIVCGVDGSPGARAALRVAASIAKETGARLVGVHVLDRIGDAGPTAERVAANVLYQEVPDARADARGEVGNVAERLAATARDEGAPELAELTDVPVLVAPLQLAADPTVGELAALGGFR